eukprot:TRINITY_DN10123_c0_g1_i1.p1 TRINITY_DN10123_c0_g1~~TRINITY_DN10123_c0_g1_i1.p1  ORF type:complete len:1117 (+),score=415.56 TRINITY_DN10123_c0_g1_i1:143-3493(+)
MSWLGGLLGTSSQEEQVSVPLLTQRVADAVTVDDRRRAVHLIKAISENSSYHKALGASVPVLLSILKTDREDVDLARSSLQILADIMTAPSTGQATTEAENAAAFVKDTRNVATILELAQEHDAGVRYHTVQLLRIVTAFRLSETQQAVLAAPLGVGHLMDLLRDSREMVRNEVLLLLCELTKSNQEIQKIIAFEGAFDVVFEIIYDDGPVEAHEGGVIVNDCLQFANTLLRANHSNQNYFRETGSLSKMLPLLNVNKTDMWILTDDKASLLLLALETLSLLLPTNNPSRTANLAALAKCGVLQLVIPLALGSMNNAHIRVKALMTLGDLLYGSKEHATRFSLYSFPPASSRASDGGPPPPPVPAVARLLAVALGSRDPAESGAAVRAFRCFLYENEEGQLALASTVTPSAISSSSTPQSLTGLIEGSVTVGSILLHALLDWEPQGPPQPAWYSSCILGYILRDSPRAKDLLLRIPLEIPKQGVPMVTLLTRSMRVLTLLHRTPGLPNASPLLPSPGLLVRVGLLRLLGTWLDDCGGAVKSFLDSATNLSFLVEIVLQHSPHSDPHMVGTGNDGFAHVQGLAAFLIGLCFICNQDQPSSQQQASLQGIIVQRIGIERLLDALDRVRRSPEFQMAEQGKSEVDGGGQQLNLYDYDWTVHFKAAYDRIHRQLKSPKPQSNAVSTPQQARPSAAPPAPASASSDAILQSYKDLINTQTRELEMIKTRNHELEERIRTLDEQLQNNAARSPAAGVSATGEYVPTQLEEQLLHERQQMIGDIEKMRAELEMIGPAYTAQTQELQGLVQAFNQLEAEHVKQDDANRALRAQLEAANNAGAVSVPVADPAVQRDLQQAREEVQRLNGVVASLSSELDRLRPQTAELDGLHDELHRLRLTLAAVTAERDSLSSQSNADELGTLRHELSAIRTERDQLRSEAGGLQQRLDLAQASLQEADDTLSSLETTQLELSSLRSRYATLTAERDAATAERPRLERERDELRSGADQLRHELSSVQGQLAASLADAAAARRELDTLRSQASQPAAAANAPDVSGLQTEVSLLTAENQKLQSSLKQAELRFKSLEKEQDDLLEVFAKLEIDNNNLKARISLHEPDFGTDSEQY